MSKPERDTTSDARLELACFSLAGVACAVDVAQVREISRCPPLAPLPHAPVLIEGVVELHGVVLPVVDLGRVLGRAPVGDAPHARLAVLEVDELRFGLRVGADVDVLSVGLAEVEAVPALASQAGYEAVRAVVRRAGAAPLLVLSLEALLERVYRSGAVGEAA